MRRTPLSSQLGDAIKSLTLHPLHCELALGRGLDLGLAEAGVPGLTIVIFSLPHGDEVCRGGRMERCKSLIENFGDCSAAGNFNVT